MCSGFSYFHLSCLLLQHLFRKIKPVPDSELRHNSFAPVKTSDAAAGVGIGAQRKSDSFRFEYIQYSHVLSVKFLKRDMRMPERHLIHDFKNLAVPLKSLCNLRGTCIIEQLQGKIQRRKPEVERVCKNLHLRIAACLDHHIAENIAQFFR